MPLSGYTLAFDLDGTLVDTAPDLVLALNVSMQGSGIGDVDISQVRNLIGQGARALIKRAFETNGIEPGEAEIDARLAVFLEYYYANITNKSQVFAGAITCLETLNNAGARLSICTNKSENLTLNLLHALDLKKYFDGIYCPENVSAKKPDAAHVLAAIAPSPVNKALMIGDSRADMQSARAAKVPILLMSHGYTDTPAHELGGDMVLDNFSQVPEAVFHTFNLTP